MQANIWVRTKFSYPGVALCSWCRLDKAPLSLHNTDIQKHFCSIASIQVRYIASATCERACEHGYDGVSLSFNNALQMVHGSSCGHTADVAAWEIHILTCWFSNYKLWAGLYCVLEYMHNHSCIMIGDGSLNTVCHPKATSSYQFATMMMRMMLVLWHQLSTALAPVHSSGDICEAGCKRWLGCTSSSLIRCMESIYLSSGGSALEASSTSCKLHIGKSWGKHQHWWKPRCAIKRKP